jgi:hypothetical protein
MEVRFLPPEPIFEYAAKDPVSSGVTGWYIMAGGVEGSAASADLKASTGMELERPAARRLPKA